MYCFKEDLLLTDVKLVNMISFIYLNHRHHGLLVFDAVMVLVRLRR